MVLVGAQLHFYHKSIIQDLSVTVARHRLLYRVTLWLTLVLRFEFQRVENHRLSETFEVLALKLGFSMGITLAVLVVGH